MEVFEVYSNCIPERLILARIKCEKEDKESITKERKNFLSWLVNLDKFYYNQLDAWAVYDSSTYNDNINNPEYEEEEEDFAPLQYLEEIEERQEARAPYLLEVEMKQIAVDDIEEEWWKV